MVITVRPPRVKPQEAREFSDWHERLMGHLMESSGLFVDCLLYTSDAADE